MTKSTFLTVEFNKKLSIEEISLLENLINQHTNKEHYSAVVSNLQYKKGQFFV